MEPKLANTKGIKTYLNSRNKILNSPNSGNSKVAKSEPLTTKDAVRFLLQGTLKWRVCRFCLTTTTSLSELDEILEVASAGALYQVTIRDMIATFYPYQVEDDANFPNKICGKCLDKTLNCYIFAQQCERADRALRNCFDDINEKFDKLDPLERVKRRGRQKLNPNHNVLHSDYEKVMSYADPLINIVNVGATLEETPEHTEINELECPKCWQVLPNIESFTNHEKIHPKSMWFNCRLCGQSFIKHTQYKKHIKQCQICRMLPAPSIKKKEFRCSECGVITEDFGKHLQHVEKHKFKNILEHLIERKMDDLCGVCLDQGEKMVDLKETFHLHAGYPELTGEKTLARVLRESVPERGYKYEEFYMANKPDVSKVMRYVNTLKNTDIHNIADECIKSDLIYASINTFEIMEKISKSKMSYAISNQFIFPDNLGLVVDIDLINFNPMNVKNYVNNNQLSNMNIKDSLANIESIKKIPCKICWIYKDAQCETCIKEILTNSRKNSSIYNEKIKNCNMCWVFVKVGKCDFCRAVFKFDDSETSEIEIKERIGKRKRNFNDEPEIMEAKLKWQQNKCLTYNDYTKACVTMIYTY